MQDDCVPRFFVPQEILMTDPSAKLRIIVAQLNCAVGDLHGNADKIIAAAQQARDHYQADLIVFPELALSGYPPDDLLLYPDFIRQTKSILQRLCNEITGIAALVGTPLAIAQGVHNSAVLIHNGAIQSHYHQQYFSHDNLFNKHSYFLHGHGATVLETHGIKIRISIGEELAQPKLTSSKLTANAQLIINLGAYPYHTTQSATHLTTLQQRAKTSGVPIISTHLVGAHDELVFAGHSLVINADGILAQRMPLFSEGLYPVDLRISAQGIAVMPSALAEEAPLEAVIYETLVFGLRDYVNKNHFPGVIVGASGGIDSALVLAIAVDALGAERVEAVLLPSRYTAEMSNADALREAEALGIKHRCLPIEPLVESTLDTLQPLLGAERVPDILEENVQARCRGILLMALSNYSGKLVLATSNKSESAVGYSTLYGDMVGGFAPLKDVLKTMVYRLANWRNKQSPVIPQRVIDRPPSAELRPEQTDQDSLPPYDILDALLQGFIEERRGIAELVAAGFEPEIVRSVIRLVTLSEYKRHQSAPGIQISRHAFGRNWNYPLTSAFRH